MSKIEDPRGKRKPYDLKVTAPITGAPFTRVVVSPEEWLQVPEHISAEVETDGYLLTLVTGVDDELRPIVDKITVERKPGAPAISGDVLNRLGCGDVLKHMVERGSFRWVLDHDRNVWTMVDLGPPLEEASRHAFRRFRRPTDPTIDAEARAAAALLREANENSIRGYRAYIAEKLGLSIRTVTRRLALAAERGYLED